MEKGGGEDGVRTAEKDGWRNYVREERNERNDDVKKEERLDGVQKERRREERRGEGAGEERERERIKELRHLGERGESNWL